MKKFLLLILICSAQVIFSQTSQKGNSKDNKTNVSSQNNTQSPEDDNQIYNTAGLDVAPQFPGGIEALNGFIKQNFKNPKEGLKGRIYATFIIEKDGSLSDIKILRDLGHETGAEALRVLQLSPKWSPGKQNNKIVRVLYSIPMTIN